MARVGLLNGYSKDDPLYEERYNVYDKYGNRQGYWKEDPLFKDYTYEKKGQKKGYIKEDSLSDDPAALADTPVFWAHGTQDPAVPFSLAIDGRRRLQSAGVGANTRDYPIGHWVTPEEMGDLKEWLEETVPGWKVPPFL